MIKLKDLFSDFKDNDYYHNLTKNDKRKYNYSFIVGDNNNPNHIKYFIKKNII